MNHVLDGDVNQLAEGIRDSRYLVGYFIEREYMKIGKLNISEWTYDKYKIRNPFDIVRRLVFFPIIICLRAILVVAVFLGAGHEESLDMWRRTDYL